MHCDNNEEISLREEVIIKQEVEKSIPEISMAFEGVFSLLYTVLLLPAYYIAILEPIAALGFFTVGQFAVKMKKIKTYPDFPKLTYFYDELSCGKKSALGRRY